MVDFIVALAIGYCLAVLFPVPWLSQYILDAWTKLVYKIRKG